MPKAKSNPKKPTKNIRSVLAQPFKSVWPRIPDNDVERCTELLQAVESKHIISGCNNVIKLLEKGEGAACFVLDSFHPQMLAKLIIQMARKRNPKVLVLALPSFPKGCYRNSVLMAITKPKVNDGPNFEPVKALLKWMKKVSKANGFIAENPKKEVAHNRNNPLPKVKPPNDEPMTDAEVAKLYVFEPRDAEAQGKKSKKRVANEAEHFISFSDNASSIVVSKNEYQQQNNEPRKKPVTDRKPSKGESYIPLTVNRVQGNPNRVEHKKKRRTQ